MALTLSLFSSSRVFCGYNAETNVFLRFLWFSNWDLAMPFGSYNQEILHQERLAPIESSSTASWIIIIFVVVYDSEFKIM